MWSSYRSAGAAESKNKTRGASFRSSGSSGSIRIKAPSRDRARVAPLLGAHGRLFGRRGLRLEALLELGLRRRGLVGQPRLDAQDDPVRLGIDARHLQLEHIVRLEAVRGLLQSLDPELGERDESFQTVLQIDDNPAIQKPDDLALHDHVGE